MKYLGIFLFSLVFFMIIVLWLFGIVALFANKHPFLAITLFIFGFSVGVTISYWAEENI